MMGMCLWLWQSQDSQGCSACHEQWGCMHTCSLGNRLCICIPAWRMPAWVQGMCFLGKMCVLRKDSLGTKWHGWGSLEAGGRRLMPGCWVGLSWRKADRSSSVAQPKYQSEQCAAHTLCHGFMSFCLRARRCQGREGQADSRRVDGKDAACSFPTCCFRAKWWEGIAHVDTIKKRKHDQSFLHTELVLSQNWWAYHFVWKRGLWRAGCEEPCNDYFKVHVK